MKTLLRIDSSMRRIDSVSRTLGDFFVLRWKAKNPEGRIIIRDLGASPVPHLTQPEAQAFFGGPTYGNELALSDALIDEIKTSDELLITCPMYNFQIPSSLKAYFDHVVRVNETFSHQGGEYVGLLTDKPCYLLTSMGGRKPDVNQEAGFESYLRNILGFMGIVSTRIFCIDGTANADYVNSALPKAKNKIINSI